MTALRSLAAFLAAALCLGVGAPAAHAQAFSPDRPGLGDGVAVVGAGVGQVELGAAVVSDPLGTGGEVGQVLLRYGVTPLIELRGVVGSVALDRPETEYTGTSLGVKAALLQTPTSALSAQTTVGLPTGTGAFDTDVAQTIKLIYNGALGEGLSLTVNGGTTLIYGDEATSSFFLIPTLNVSVTDRVGAYVGYAGTYTEATNANLVEAGLTVLSALNTQLDVNTGLRLDEGRDDYFIGVGLAHRF